MQLYGTVTSPYVRRVRVVASLVGAPIELVDTSTPEGQAELRTVTPLWKVPTLVTDEGPIFDSQVINDWLLSCFGQGKLRRAEGVAERNVMTVVDGALDALINAFYLGKDGAQPDNLPYLRKQLDRARAALTWVEAQLEAGIVNAERQLGLTDIALVTALDWMRFRDTYPVDRHAGLMKFLEAHGKHPELVATRPPKA